MVLPATVHVLLVAGLSTAPAQPAQERGESPGLSLQEGPQERSLDVGLVPS